MDLSEALEAEYRQREQDYRMARNGRLEDAILANLHIMNAIQRIRERAGLPRLEEAP